MPDTKPAKKPTSPFPKSPRPANAKKPSRAIDDDAITPCFADFVAFTSDICFVLHAFLTNIKSLPHKDPKNPDPDTPVTQLLALQPQQIESSLRFAISSIGLLGQHARQQLTPASTHDPALQEDIKAMKEAFHLLAK